MNQGVSEVEKGSSLIDTAGAVFEEISAAVEVISDQVREVSAATEQMSASSEKSRIHAGSGANLIKIPSVVPSLFPQLLKNNLLLWKRSPHQAVPKRNGPGASGNLV
ncbi:hypothetical protein P7H17_12285 [Paenibacillus larvae]|nr:hypothetical protein [Paenibacillus larvae]MDT2286665.1 hypothetical protein [Paenibacillus larvae]